VTARADQLGMDPQPKGTWAGADYLALTKPGIVRMCLLMTAGGLWLAPATVGSSKWITWTIWIAALVGSSLAVASANAFNMVWEREGDRLMARTRMRPLAAGRLGVASSSVFAGVLGLAAMVVLALGTNWLTTGLAAFALLSYVLIYTPLKRRTPLALVIGAVPGAVPPLLGWTAVTNSLDLPGAVLFGILLVWQMPLLAGLAFLGFALMGLRHKPGDGPGTLRWARQLFALSLVYLPLVTVALVVDLLWLARGAT
jgi:protoheme IX farnesyltransferase